MARTESIQSDCSNLKAPDEHLKERPTSFERIESQPEFVKMVNDPGMLYPPPRRPFLNPSPLSSSSELTLSIPNPSDAIAEKGVYFQPRPTTLRLASGSSVSMLRDSSNRYSGYSSADSTVNFIPDHDERLEERSPTVVEAPLFPIKKQPQLSWTLTVLLLILVTAVSFSDMLGGQLVDTCRPLNRL